MDVVWLIEGPMIMHPVNMPIDEAVDNGLKYGWYYMVDWEYDEGGA